MQNLNISYLIATFLGSLAVSHVLLLWLFNFSALVWKRIDFYWLATSVITACVSLQAIAYSERKDESRRLKEAVVEIKQDLFKAVDRGTELACIKLMTIKAPTFIATPAPLPLSTSKAAPAVVLLAPSAPPVPLSLLNRDIEICNWFKETQNALHPPYENTKIPQPLNMALSKLVQQSAKQFPNDFLSGEVSQLAGNYGKALEEYKQSEIDMDVYGAWKHILQLCSYLIAALLGLRITKVTADLQMEKNKTKLKAGKGAYLGNQPKLTKQLQFGYIRRLKMIRIIFCRRLNKLPSKKNKVV